MNSQQSVADGLRFAPPLHSPTLGGKLNINMKGKFKDILQLSLLSGATGFLIGDLIVGIIIWLIKGMKAGQWGSSSALRMHYGIVFGLIGLIIGPIIFSAQAALKKKKH